MFFGNFDFVKIMRIQMMIAVYKSSSLKSKYMYVHAQSFYGIVFYILYLFTGYKAGRKFIRYNYVECVARKQDCSSYRTS